MDEQSAFIIKTENGFSLAFAEPKLAENGWLNSFTIVMNAPDLTSSVRVENPPFGHSPLGFFQAMAREWRGWSGRKEWAAIEGELSFSSTSDSTGHVTLVCQTGEKWNSPSWAVKFSLVIEAGQLEAWADQARHFFKV